MNWSGQLTNWARRGGGRRDHEGRRRRWAPEDSWSEPTPISPLNSSFVGGVKYPLPKGEQRVPYALNLVPLPGGAILSADEGGVKDRIGVGSPELAYDSVPIRHPFPVTPLAPVAGNRRWPDGGNLVKKS